MARGRVVEPWPPARYRPVADYAAIGDGRSVALVAGDGAIDWWAPARFDGPSLFAAILDAGRGGSWILAPTAAATTTRRYVDGTNVLETVHGSPEGSVVVHDLLVLEDDAPGGGPALVRSIVGTEGEVPMRTRFEPRFQYGRVAARFSPHARGLLATGAGEVALLESPGLVWERPARGSRSAEFRVRARERLALVLRHAPVASPVPFPRPLPDAQALEAATIARWRAWAARTRYDGPRAALVQRSALALKLLQHAQSGAFVAAATTSLPEAIGGIRNWDYRYTWLRDGALAARALHDLGHTEEPIAFARWIGDTVGEAADALRIVYTLSGSPDLPERELPLLEGYRASGPVRIGNDAAHQRQLDVYGELVDYLVAMGARAHWPLVRNVADWVVEHWREPDQGIWEMRCEPRHFVLSKAMAWVALDRAESFARTLHETPAPAWRATAHAIRAEVLERGYDPLRGSFLQAYGFPHLDASNLLLPLVGFVDARDPRMVATVDRTLEELTVDGLVYRYLADDGLPPGEATFAYCTFWLVEVLARQGRVEEARRVFSRIADRASPLGLFAEEIDVATGEHLGNYPQAFPHAGLIQAALALRRAEAGGA